GFFSLAPLCAGLASDTNSASPAGVSTPTVSIPAPVIEAAPASAPVKLPYGVEDVLKLSRAQIGDEIIVNYIHNSGTIYNLQPQDIVYLRQNGVSDKVLNTMLTQRPRVEAAAQYAANQVQGAPAVSSVPSMTEPGNEQVAPPVDSSATYVTAPLTPPASSSYVIPYPAASSAYYGYSYPYYYGPSVGFAFGFGGYGCYGGHYYGHG